MEMTAVNAPKSARGLAQSKTLTRQLATQVFPTGFGVRQSSAVLQYYSVTPAEPFRADLRQASCTCCVFSTHIGQSPLSLPENT